LEINTHLFDEDSAIFQQSFFQFRYCLILMTKPETEIETLEKLCLDSHLALSKKMVKNNNSPIIFEEILNNFANGLSITEDKDGIHKINFSLKKSGKNKNNFSFKLNL
jgi:hypothetical protein